MNILCFHSENVKCVTSLFFKGFGDLEASKPCHASYTQSY